MDVSLMMKKKKIFDTSRLRNTPGNVVSPVASSVNSKENYELDGSSMSCCSRNGSSNSKSLDLDAKGGEVAEKEKKSIQEESESDKMPPFEEFEEFFKRHEQRTCKRLREKYNFDFEKEEPLEGRYKWVKI